MEELPQGKPIGIDVPPYAEFEVPEPSIDMRLARYAVRRERGGAEDPELEPLLKERQEKAEAEAQGGIDVPPYAEFEVPEPSIDMRLARYAVRRERGGAEDPELEPLLQEQIAKERQAA